MDSILDEVMNLALKLEESVVYAIPTSSQRLFRKFAPITAHTAINNININPDQSQLRCYQCGRLDSFAQDYRKQPKPGLKQLRSKKKTNKIRYTYIIELVFSFPMVFISFQSDIY